MTDHRINLTLYSLDRVMQGDLEDLTTALRERDLQDRLNHELEGFATGSNLK